MMHKMLKCYDRRDLINRDGNDFYLLELLDVIGVLSNVYQQNVVLVNTITITFFSVFVYDVI
jgi:hypothetical protein